jgi:hypothetical protein
MAGRGLGTLTLDLAVKIGGFTAGLDKAGRELDKRSKKMQQTASNIGKAIGASLLAAATAVGFAVKSAIDRADQLNSVSQKIGVTTESLSRMAYAADQTDVSLEQLQTGLVRLTKFQASAAQGNKEAIATFEAFGIAVKDNEGNLRDTEAVLQDFAKVFRTLPDGPEKTALAVRVLGKSGADLIPLLNEFEKLTDEAERLGLTVSTKTGRQADEFNDAVARLKAGLGAMSTDIASKVLPELLNLLGVLNDLDKGGFGAAIGDELAEGLDFARKSITRTRIELEELQKFAQNPGLAGSGPFGYLMGAVGALGKASDRAKVANRPVPTLKPFAFMLEPTEADRRAQRETEDAARKLLATTQASTKASKGDSEAKRAAAEAAREQAERERELAEAIEKADQATKDFNRQLEDLVAQQGGPLAESALRYRREEEALVKLHAEGSIPNAEKLAQAIAILHKARDDDAESIRRNLDTGQQQLDQMREELELLQATSIAERDRLAFMQNNPTASLGQADAAASIGAQIDETRRAIAAMDDFRDTFEDSVVDVVTGAQSISDAFKNMADQVIQQITRIIAQQLTASLFGDPGTTGGGSAGGWLGQVFGALIGGKKYAGGTDFAPGGMSLVGERGPEIVNLPRGAQVIPNHKMGGANIVINIAGNATRETAQYTANKVAQKLAFSRRG